MDKQYQDRYQDQERTSLGSMQQTHQNMEVNTVQIDGNKSINTNVEPVLLYGCVAWTLTK